MSDLHPLCQRHIDRADRLLHMAHMFLGKGYFDPDLAASCKRLAERHREVAFLKHMWIEYKEPNTRIACMLALRKKSLAEAEFWKLRGHVRKAWDATEVADAWDRQATSEFAALTQKKGR